jgi:hypothetical protein
MPNEAKQTICRVLILWNPMHLSPNPKRSSYDSVGRTLSSVCAENVTWATAEVGVINENDDDTEPEPAEVRAKLVSFLWSSHVDAELASRSASPPCCLAVHVPPECFTMKVKTAIAVNAAHLTLRGFELYEPQQTRTAWEGTLRAQDGGFKQGLGFGGPGKAQVSPR